MGHQQITISLPDSIYQQMQKLSQTRHRSVAEEVVAVVTAALLKETSQLPAELSDLEHLSVSDLWRAAKMTAPIEKTDRMQLLVEKQQLAGLTAAEKEEAELLSQFFNRIMLVRAKAAVLLQACGQDISQLIEV